MQRNKLYSIVLSLVVAFSLWLYVVSNVSQEDDNTFYNIPVIMTGETLLTENNLMITSVSSNTVSLNLSGTRSDLNKLDNSNIIVKADVSGIDEPGEDIYLEYKISYAADVPNNAFVVQQKNPLGIYVDVDYRRNKEVDVKVKWTGTRSENYLYDTDNPILDYSTVTVVGPAAVADKIDHAVIEVDLSDRIESISEDFRYTLCDAEGNAVDAQQITTNVEQIHLEVKIQQIKMLKLAANVIYGGGATETNTIVDVQPKNIRVSGGEAVLEELGDTLTVCTVNLAELEKSTNEQKYTISLPEGVTNQTGVSEVTVTVTITGVTTRDFTVENIRSINVPEGMEAEIISANLLVKVRGPSDLLLKLKPEDISAEVDFSEAEIGGTATYKATILFAEGFESMGALKTYSVTAEVRAAAEE